MIYYISDLHFGHKRVIEMDGRPFETIEKTEKGMEISAYTYTSTATVTMFTVL